MTEALHYEVRGDIGHIVFNRPEARNALTFAMYERLSEICQGIKIGGEVKVLILSGSGTHAFAAGTDMGQFESFSEPADATNYEVLMEEVLGNLEKCPVPTIAAITGACTGGGAAIAAACDLRICDERLKFGFPIARTLGNCLSVRNLNRVAALLGPGRTADIVLTARLVGPDEAITAGLVSEVIEDTSLVETRALELANIMAQNAPLTMWATKEGLRRLRNEGASAQDTDLVVKCYMSNDFKEGKQAFLAKRKPNWTAT